jgi:ABC-type glycerol-3-phosphate transport system permease component
MATATLVLLPQILICAAFQRHVIEDMTRGAVKESPCSLDHNT